LDETVVVEARDPEACPEVPLAPPGAGVQENIKRERGNGAYRIGMYDPSFRILSAMDFYFAVRNNSRYDYKQISIIKEIDGLPWISQRSPYEDFGNFNFGAVGAVRGFTIEELLIGAGFAQTRSTPEVVGTTWQRLFDLAGADDFSDQVQIAKGFRFAQNGCSQ